MPVAKGAQLDPAQTRAELLAAATRLFYERGLDGVGVAELCAAVGASKETLYRHFGSKDGLVRAVLEERSDRVTAWLRAAADGAGEDPWARLDAVFGALEGWHEEPAFRGCAILNAAAQRHGEPARAVAVQHLDRRLRLLREIAAAAGAHDPGETGRQLLMLVAGATALADHHGDRTAARTALVAARAVLRAAVTPRR